MDAQIKISPTNKMQFNGSALSKVIWGLSPFYTVGLVYLLPLIMTARGRRFRDAAVVSWIFVILIMCSECYLLPFLAAQFDGSSDAEKVPDPMPGLAVIVLFGWIPGVLMAALGRFARLCFDRWMRRTQLP